MTDSMKELKNQIKTLKDFALELQYKNKKLMIQNSVLKIENVKLKQ